MYQHPRSFGWTIALGTYNYQPATGRSSWPIWRGLLSRMILVILLLGGLIPVFNLTIGSMVNYQPDASALVTRNLSPKEPASAKLPGAAVPDLSPQLQSVLNKWVANHPAEKWSSVVWGLDNNPTSASINANETFQTASLYKLLLTYPLFKYYSLNSLDGSFVTPEGSPPQTLRSCVEKMIKLSDNPCGLALASKLGLSRSQRLLTRLGLAHTNISGANGPVTTADDMALFLQKFYAGQLFNTQTRDYLMSLMQQQIFRDGIPAGCPHCNVADKIGDLDGVRHDVGIVRYKGGSYILVILTNGASYSQIAKLTTQIQAVMATH